MSDVLPTNSERRIGWTQPLCETCFCAWELGRGLVGGDPARVLSDGDPCLVCGIMTTIYVRIDPALAGTFKHAKERAA